MKIIKYLFLLFCISPFLAASQKHKSEPVIIEGIAADTETLKELAGVKIYNDSLNLHATSDKNGYYSIVIPESLAKSSNVIPLKAELPGYDELTMNVTIYREDSLMYKNEHRIRYTGKVSALWLSRENSSMISGRTALDVFIPISTGYTEVKTAFDKEVLQIIQNRKFQKLTMETENIFLTVDNETRISTWNMQGSAPNGPFNVYIGERQVSPEEVNKLLQRRNTSVNFEKGDSIFKVTGVYSYVFEVNKRLIPELSQQSKDLLDSSRFFLKKKDYPKVLELYDKAMKYDSTHIFILAGKSMWEVQLKEYNKAISTNKRLIQYDPDEPSYYLNVGSYYLRLSDSVSAQPYLAKTIRLTDSLLAPLKPNIRKRYNYYLFQNALANILSGKEKEGQILMLKVHELEDYSKGGASLYINKSKEEALDAYLRGFIF